MLFNYYDPEQSLLDGLSKHKLTTDFKIPDVYTQDHRWLAASSLQKSIRRGNIREALKAAHILQRFSSTHLWNRLKVIALEDIGLSDPDIVSQVLFVAGKAQWRDKHAGDGFILNYLIHQLCASVKCRVLDDALYVANYHYLYAEQRLIYSGMEEKELHELFFDENLDTIERILACWFLSGTKRYPATNLTPRQGNPNIIYDLANSIGTPQHMLDLLKLSKAQEYFVCMLPCLMQIEKSETCAVVKETSNAMQMIGNFPACSYDRHTRAGKLAFRRFLKSCPTISDFINNNLPKADLLDLVGWAVFALEGRLLDKRLTFDGSEILLKQAIQSWMQCQGMSNDLQSDFLNLMRENMEDLQDARRSVAR